MAYPPDLPKPTGPLPAWGWAAPCDLPAAAREAARIPRVPIALARWGGSQDRSEAEEPERLAGRRAAARRERRPPPRPGRPNSNAAARERGVIRPGFSPAS